MFIVLLPQLHQLSLSRHHHVNRLKLPLNQKSSSTCSQTLNVIETKDERLLQLQVLKNFNCFIRVLKPWNQGQQREILYWPCLPICCVCFTKVNLVISFCWWQVGCEGRYRHVLLGEILLPIRELSGFVSYPNRLLFLTMFLSYQLGKVCISPLK